MSEIQTRENTALLPDESSFDECAEARIPEKVEKAEASKEEDMDVQDSGDGKDKAKVIDEEEKAKAT